MEKAYDEGEEKNLIFLFNIEQQYHAGR